MIFVFGQKSEGKIYAAKSFSSRNFDYLGVLLSTILRVEFFRAMGLNVNIWPENEVGITSRDVFGYYVRYALSMVDL